MPKNRLNVAIINKLFTVIHFLRISAYEERIADNALPFIDFRDFRFF